MEAIVKYDGQDVKFCHINPEDYIEGLLLKGVWYELSNLEFIRNLHAVGTYVDIGAYIGTHSLFFSQFCDSTEVYSFEPQPKSYFKLTQNLLANDVINITKCRASNLALGAEESQADIRGANETNTGATQVVASPTGATHMVTLDSFFLSGIAVMKIDVEGFELDVLAGARATLPSVEHLFIEMWSEKSSADWGVPYTVPAVIEFLKPLGFKLRVKLTEDLHYFSR